MPEAEDVITDAARHATVFIQELWNRHRQDNTSVVDVPALFRHLDLLIHATIGTHYTLRLAEPPSAPPWIKRLFVRDELPATLEAIPATDGTTIWLPAPAANEPVGDWHLMALQQATRAWRGSAGTLGNVGDPLLRSVFEVLEADAADAELACNFPGLAGRLRKFRRECLARRPPLARFPIARRPLEAWLRNVLETHADLDATKSTDLVMEHAQRLARSFVRQTSPRSHHGNRLFRDRWLGEMRASGEIEVDEIAESCPQEPGSRPTRSARMSRRPQVRRPDERDQRTSQGAWMVQTAQPHEHAEDPFGSQRPTDRDEQQAAEEFADSLSELAQVRLVSTPAAPKEILLSEDPVEARTRVLGSRPAASERAIRYPEWDWRARSYRNPGALVHLMEAGHGQLDWVARTMDQHRSLLNAIRRQFEALRMRRVRIRQAPDGDELDLEACVDALADARAGAAMRPGLYQYTRAARRDLAVLLLVDISGSTDSWVSTHRRIIDVEREALLLVCLALESLGEPYSVLAFSGESAAGVVVRSVKSFGEAFGDSVQMRIAGLEPEKYTRAGAAVRHACSSLMAEPARHRLLLLLSDGKPNDIDEYDGRYGIEDMRQSVIEARLQGISPFCLTIDRHTASYLPAIFGEHQYSVLHRPELLPTSLVGCLRRLLQS